MIKVYGMTHKIKIKKSKIITVTRKIKEPPPNISQQAEDNGPHTEKGVSTQSTNIIELHKTQHGS